MDKFKTICVAGQLMSGKDTFSNYLAERLNSSASKWSRNAFANAVKEVFQQTFQVNRDFIEHWKRTNDIPEGFLKPVRDCLIRIGDGFRQMKENIWIELAFRNQCSNQIISDCRYISEARYVKDNGGCNILLWRPGYENNIQNASEQELVPYINKLAKLGIEGLIPEECEIPFDLFVINNSEIDDLYIKIDETVIAYLKNNKFI